MQARQELCCHAFSVHNDAVHLYLVDDLFVVRDDEGQSDRQMLIPTMRRDQQGMPLHIVKQHQSTAPKDRTQAPDHSPRNERFSVTGLPTPINLTPASPEFSITSTSSV